MGFERDWRDEETQLTGHSTDGSPPAEERERVPGLTILAHADPRRVGERIALPTLAVGREVRLSRLEPAFKAPGGSQSALDYCVNAVSKSENIQLHEGPANLIYTWTFVYQPGTDADPSWGLAFIFGDSHQNTTSCMPP